MSTPLSRRIQSFAAGSAAVRRALTLALPLALAAISPARATISAIPLTGIVQVEAADLDGVPGDELVVARFVGGARIHVYARSGPGWTETGNYAVSADIGGVDQGNFQLVPRLGSSGPVDIVYSMPVPELLLVRHRLAGMLNQGTGLFGPEQPLSPLFDRYPFLPGHPGVFPSPGGLGPKFVFNAVSGLAGTENGLYTISMPLAAIADTAFEAVSSFFIHQVGAADFNSDGFLDQLVTGETLAPVTLGLVGYYRLGLGVGTFGTWNLIGGMGDRRHPIHVGEIDGDGYPDAIFGNSYGIGNWSTAITGGATWPHGPYGADNTTGVWQFTTRFADVNEDGLDDLVASYGIPLDPLNSNEVTGLGFLIKTNDGGGFMDNEIRFPVGPAYAVEGNPFSVRVGEFTGDSHLDVAYVTPAGITIYPGNGLGGFETGASAPIITSVPLGADLLHVLELADLDGVGGKEMLIGSAATTGVGLRRIVNHGPLSFTVADALASDPVLYIGTDPATSTVYTAAGENIGSATWNTSLGSLNPWNWVATLDQDSRAGNVRGLSARDFTSDGIPDVFALSDGLAGEHYEVFEADGLGGLLPSTNVGYSGLIGAPSVGLGFLPGTNSSCFALSELGGMIALQGVTATGYSAGAASTVSAGAQPTGSAHPFELAQLAGTGGPYALIVPSSGLNQVEIFEALAGDLNNWTSSAVLATAGQPFAIAIGDLDQANGTDIAVGCRNPNSITLYRGNGGGGFIREDIALGSLAALQDVRIGDVNGDGRDDLVYISTVLTVGTVAQQSVQGTASQGSELAVYSSSGFATTSVGPRQAAGAGGRLDFAVWPNPVRGPFSVRFALPSAGRVSLELLDLSGRRVGARIERECEAGPQFWSLGDVAAAQPSAPGIYFARLSTPYGSAVRRVVRLR